MRNSQSLSQPHTIWKQSLDLWFFGSAWLLQLTRKKIYISLMILWDNQMTINILLLLDISIFFFLFALNKFTERYSSAFIKDSNYHVDNWLPRVGLSKKCPGIDWFICRCVVSIKLDNHETANYDKYLTSMTNSG